MTVTISCDLRAALGPVRDQRRRPTCMAFSASAVHQHAHAHGTPFSVEWLHYHAATRAGDGPDDGLTIEDTRAVVAALGQPEEAVWPYLADPPDPAAWIPPANVDHLFTCPSGACGHGDLQPMREQLEAGRPIVLALAISDVFFSGWTMHGDEVLLADDDADLDLTLGHAVVAVGYGKTDAAPLTLIRNSWGKSWAAAGHAWLPNSYIQRRIFGAFTINHGDDHALPPDGAEPNARTRVG